MDQWEYLKVIKNCALPNFERIYGLGNYMMLQDNFAGHKTDVVMAYIKSKNIDLLDFPPRSPDLNIIENYWSLIQRNVNRYNFFI